jgi:hypothetical protein
MINGTMAIHAATNPIALFHPASQGPRISSIKAAR